MEVLGGRLWVKTTLCFQHPLFLSDKNPGICWSLQSSHKIAVSLSHLLRPYDRDLADEEEVPFACSGNVGLVLLVGQSSSNRLGPKTKDLAGEGGRRGTQAPQGLVEPPLCYHVSKKQEYLSFWNLRFSILII